MRWCEVSRRWSGQQEVVGWGQQEVMGSAGGGEVGSAGGGEVGSAGGDGISRRRLYRCMMGAVVQTVEAHGNSCSPDCTGA
uniref:Uncharacterized protein n=1 Tax=Knipowitschia caucasica TaxID=637954 RepID=A0AAV2LR64_KNICA